MDTTASSFTLRKNAKRAAGAMIRKGTARAIDYAIKPSDDGRFEIVWKAANTTPTTGKVETEIVEASADQPAASAGEKAPQPAPGATEPAAALSEPAPPAAGQPGRAEATAPRKAPRSRYAIGPEAIAAGKLPDKAPAITSEANPHYQKHFDRLFALAKAGDWDAVRDYKVTGSNSYSKMVARYRQDLLALHAASEAAQ
jgi:hypothetical protein